MENNKPLILLSLGWGVQSWTLAAMTAMKCQCVMCERLGVTKLPMPDVAIHADTKHERQDTYAFAAEWLPWLTERELYIEVVSSTRTDVVRRSKDGNPYLLIPAFTYRAPTEYQQRYACKKRGRGAFLLTQHTDRFPVGIWPMQTIRDAGGNGQMRRQCTGDWKIDPQDKRMRQIMKERGLKKAPGAVIKWLGISRDEWTRAKESPLPYVTHVYPLLDMGMTRQDCITWLLAHNLPVPPKSACVFCPFHNAAAWADLKRRGGEDWDHALDVDIQIREVHNHAGVQKAGQLFVHPARKPLSEAVTIPEDYGYAQSSLLAPNDELNTTCDSGHCFL